VNDTSPTPWLHPVTGQPMRRLEFHITYQCPERCTFCSEETRMADYSAFPVTFGRVARVLREQAERGVEAVHFTGGEPTIHPQFVEILQLARKLGMRTSIGTIGTRLSDPGFAARALPYLDEALFSLHGPDAAVHDAQTRRPGSFVRLSRAMELARQQPGFRLFVNTVLVRNNAAHIVETVRLANERGAELIVVSNVTPEGAGEAGYPALTLRLDEVRTLVPRILEAAGASIVRFFGLPACALGDARMYANDLHWNPRVTFEWARHPDRVSLEGIYSWAPDRKRTQTAVCGSCSWNRLCHGVFTRYVELYGDTELRAVEAP
jgi:MoaA/NifB/PqqE/SkfB family radical SAM enzyme